MKSITKNLIIKYNKKLGKSNQGQILTKYRSVGHKKKYRKTNDVFCKESKYCIIDLNYSAYRKNYIMLVKNLKENKYNYLPMVKGYSIGDYISYDQKLISPKSYGPLKNALVNTKVCYLHQGNKIKYLRSNGSYGTVLKHLNEMVAVKMPSGYIKLFDNDTVAVKGMCLSIPITQKVLLNKKKAGRNSWVGRRPRVRAVAMNPVDHPMGGGEGKSSGGRFPCDSNGRLSKGFKSKKKKLKIKTKNFELKKKLEYKINNDYKNKYSKNKK